MNPTRFGVSLLALAAVTTAQAFVIDQPQGGDTFGARSTGQTFTPGIGAVPSPGVGNPVLLLTEIELYHGNLGSNNPSTTTWLKIYDGDPNNGGNFVGISTNTVDTTGLSFHTLMHWDFGQLPLLTTTEYWAVMSTSSSSTSIDHAEVGLETSNRSLPPPGPYAGGAGLIANIVKHQNDVDARFTVRFFNGTLGQFLVAGTGCPSSAGLATLSSQGVPRIGQTFTADFGNMSTVGLPYAVVGLSDVMWNAIPLPFPLVSLVPGTDPTCLVMVSPDATSPLTRIGTTATFSLPVPNASSLPGLILHLQGAQLETTGFSVTPKGTMVIGN